MKRPHSIWPKRGETARSIRAIAPTLRPSHQERKRRPDFREPLRRGAVHERGAGRSADRGVRRIQFDRETMQSLMDKGVEYCMPLYVDVHGIAKTKTVPIDHFDRMMRGSELFTGAALDGLGQGPHDDELAVMPDPRAVMQLPWRPNVAVIPGQLSYHEQPYPMCSRSVLARADRARRQAWVEVQPRHRMRDLYRAARPVGA